MRILLAIVFGLITTAARQANLLRQRPLRHTPWKFHLLERQHVIAAQRKLYIQ